MTSRTATCQPSSAHIRRDRKSSSIIRVWLLARQDCQTWFGLDESVCGPSLIAVSTKCSGTLVKLWDTIIVLFRDF